MMTFLIWVAAGMLTGGVVLPLPDWCLGTLLTRAPVCFRQARGPSVPDVQPLIPNLAEDPPLERAARLG